MDLASWQDLIEMKKEHLKQIESEAIILIKEKMKEYQEYTSIIPVSMGKDSMLTCYLVRRDVYKRQVSICGRDFP